MERLTWEDYNGGCYAQDILLQDYDTATVFTGEPIDRLAAYERTNHTPEECTAAFEELAAYRAAEQDGTLLRLPCKVGDTVWILCNVFGGNEQKRVIESRTITEIKHNKFNKNTMISKEPFELHFFPSEIGKTVFLTREAAEAALKEQEANQ